MTIGREELHRRVWDKPLYEVARELGVSGAALAKICDRHLVPRPAAGYWWQAREQNKRFASTLKPSKCEPFRAQIVDAINRGLSIDQILVSLDELGARTSWSAVQRYVARVNAGRPRRTVGANKWGRYERTIVSPQKARFAPPKPLPPGPELLIEIKRARQPAYIEMTKVFLELAG